MVPCWCGQVHPSIVTHLRWQDVLALLDDDDEEEA